MTQSQERMTANPRPEFDRAKCKKELAELLQKSGINPDHSEALDASFASLLVAKRLLFGTIQSPLTDLRSGAKLLSDLSRSLAVRMHFDSESTVGVFSPELLEFLSEAFDARVGDPSDDDLPLKGKIQGWHRGQWGVWSQRLADDLYLLHSLTTQVRLRLKDGDSCKQASPAMTEEGVVLEIHALLSQFLPKGKGAKAVDDLIADIMRIYHLDATTDADEEENITTDKVRGILRKHKKVGMSR